MDLVAFARRIVVERFPGARAAVLAGSVAAGRATATSDLDIVVLAGPDDRVREAIRVEGVPVELFVHTDESVAYWFEREREQGRCTLAHMLATGLPLAGAEVAQLQELARRHLAAGPSVWTAQLLEHRRFALTDALDDLAGATDAGERDVVAGQVLVMAAELALGSRGAWLGTGKWLLRRLREDDPELAEQLLTGHRSAVASGDVSGLVRLCDTVLDGVGGRLSEGFVRRGS
ncbi:hypothetical protein CELL_02701 [Cellulomonas sp. T2.31MG-18]|uniref:nucleotidyltransferase domain-containing protein n=1 Tax=Cellulomonas sp. T2.31MG-18 TaxID=3157619 RepID=UPI0035E68A9A